MKLRSTLIGVAAVALLLTSALPSAGRDLTTLYTLDVSCTMADGTPAYPSHLVDLPKKAALNSLKVFIETRDCIRNTVVYTITPQA